MMPASGRRGMAQRGVLFAGALLVAGCGPTSSGEPVRKTSQPLSSICGAPPGATTFDGYPAYAYCGDFNVYSNDGKHTRSTPASGWVKTEGGYGYQCVELAIRYFRFRWGVSASWGVMGAKQMCGTHPSGVVKTTSPVKGDLMVFGAGSCGADKTWGHVGVVNGIKGTTIHLVQQNPAGNSPYQKSCAECFLHAKKNAPTTGSGGSTGSAGSGGASAGGAGGAGGSTAAGGASGSAGASGSGAAYDAGGAGGASGSDAGVAYDAGAPTGEHSRVTSGQSSSCDLAGEPHDAPGGAFALLLLGAAFVLRRRRG